MLSRLWITAVTLAVVTLPASTATAAAEGVTDPHCQQQYIGVSLSPGQPASSSISGWLCWRGSLEGKDRSVPSAWSHLRPQLLGLA